ncbi:MAG: 2-oxo acid dehydrogenase subunit E2 [Spirochaetaceae bacterium]|nr:2-oxo acid dehydrogenase subunit E2 [Spirochaetaceae bacterium]
MFKKRPDGTYLKDIPAHTKIVPFILPTRISGTIFAEQEIDITETLQFLRRFNKQQTAQGKAKITFFQLFMMANIRSIALRPKINRFTMGYRMWQRNHIRMNFIAKKVLTDDAEEIWISGDYSPFETLGSIGDKYKTLIREATRGDGNESEDLNVTLMKLPRFVARFVFWMFRKLDWWNILPASLMEGSPFHGSVCLTNVGSVGVEAPQHHLFDMGTCGLFVSVGIVRREWKPDSKGNMRQRDLVKVVYSYDDRICDGMYGGRTIVLIKKLTENPEELLEVPELTAVQLEALMLKDYPPSMANAPESG